MDSSPSPDGRRSTPPPTILLAEDEPDSAELMAHILEVEGLRVVQARTGPDALACLMDPEQKIDAALLDVMLPGLDGFEICRKIRADARIAGMPVAFLSARTREDDRRAGLEAGADVYLAKPISRAALVSAARWLLDPDRQKTAAPGDTA